MLPSYLIQWRLSSLLYDQTNDCHTGYVNLAGIGTKDSEELATEALVFLIINYKKKFKCPIAYYLVNKINAQTQSELLLHVIRELYDISITVHSLTGDRAQANIKTFQLLGCKLFPVGDEKKMYFIHPSCSNIRVNCFLDPSHMIKLCRNCLTEVKEHITSDKGHVAFEYIEKLYKLQEEENLRLANKLSSMHIHYKRKKTNFKLATQTLSSGVADAIEFLDNSGYPGFVNSAATVEFLQVFDNLFDIMNARNIYGTKYKSPMPLQNISFWTSAFESTGKYILSLKCGEELLIAHP